MRSLRQKALNNMALKTPTKSSSHEEPEVVVEPPLPEGKGGSSDILLPPLDQPIAILPVTPGELQWLKEQAAADPSNPLAGTLGGAAVVLLYLLVKAVLGRVIFRR